ncbi:MAG TPA: hypothetical protein VGE27_02650 [Gemmatimonas sp.]|uniref:hypothetical protein n=1 Tax=Gemmatimonas sp. TaxID=1962908 RepID=UPI002EDAD48C
MHKERRYVRRTAIATVLFGLGLMVSALHSMGIGYVVPDGNLTPRIVFVVAMLAIGRWAQLQWRHVAQRELFFRTPSQATRQKCLIGGFWILLFAGNLIAEHMPGGISAAALMALGVYTIWVGAAEALQDGDLQQEATANTT